MKVWVLAKKRNFRKYPNKRMKEEAEKLGIDLKLVAPEDFEITEPIVMEGKQIRHKNKWVDLPDCLIPRIGSGATYFSLAVVRLFEQLGVFILNDSASIEHAKDKMQSIQMLAQANIPIPKTILAKVPINMRFVKKVLSFPLIFKMLTGSFGRGVALCENASQLQDILAIATRGRDSGNVILQEFVSTSKGKDIRVFVVGGHAIGAMLRTAKKGEFKANFSAGAKVETFPLTQELEWLAVESARVLGLEVAGVDILFDKDGYKVCEVNSNPGIKGFEKATDINVPYEILHYLQVRLEGVRS